MIYLAIIQTAIIVYLLFLLRKRQKTLKATQEILNVFQKAGERYQEDLKKAKQNIAALEKLVATLKKR